MTKRDAAAAEGIAGVHTTDKQSEEGDISSHKKLEARQSNPRSGCFVCVGGYCWCLERCFDN